MTKYHPAPGRVDRSADESISTTPVRTHARTTSLRHSVFVILSSWGISSFVISESAIPHLSATDARAAVVAAEEIFNGFRSKGGELSLLDLKLQKNTIAGILHNLIGEQIARRSDYWSFRESGAAGGDLIGKNEEHLELKTSSSLGVKGNQVSHNYRYYLVSNFVLRPKRLVVVWVRGGKLAPEDWRRPKGTQWAFLNESGEKKLQTIWQDFGELPPSHIKGIGEVREKRLAKAGIYSLRKMSKLSVERLREVLQVSEKQAKEFLEAAKGVE
jgi:hypothetical protein